MEVVDAGANPSDVQLPRFKKCNGNWCSGGGIMARKC